MKENLSATGRTTDQRMLRETRELIEPLGGFDMSNSEAFVRVASLKCKRAIVVHLCDQTRATPCRFKLVFGAVVIADVDWVANIASMRFATLVFGTRSAIRTLLFLTCEC